MSEWENCYNYIVIAGKNKRKAFVKGWNAAKTGNFKCPYGAKIKTEAHSPLQMPTCPFYKYWHLGFESYGLPEPPKE